MVEKNPRVPVCSGTDSLHHQTAVEGKNERPLLQVWPKESEIMNMKQITYSWCLFQFSYKKTLWFWALWNFQPITVIPEACCDLLEISRRQWFPSHRLSSRLVDQIVVNKKQDVFYFIHLLRSRIFNILSFFFDKVDFKHIFCSNLIFCKKHGKMISYLKK